MTIKDLAEKTGYSVATISRVINKQPNVSEKARSVIAAAVEESGFQININAKQLKQHATSILVVVKGTSNEMFSEMLETIQTLVAQTNYPLHVAYVDEDSNEVLSAIQFCREKKPLGILFLGGNSRNFINDYDKIDLPCVLVSSDGSNVDNPHISSVCTDDRQAARCAMDALVALGHKKIVIVGGDKDISDTCRLRYEGCMQSLSRHGIAFNSELDYRGVHFSYKDGYDAAQQLISDGREFTALFAMADVMAIGAIRALHDNGLRVPQDVSVMGFDGLPIASYMVPQLSTVIQDVDGMARRSFELLIDNIENGSKARHMTVPFVLSRNESTRRIDE